MVIKKRRKAKTQIETFSKEQYVPQELADKFTLWMLRVIVKLNGFNDFIDKYGNFRSDEMAYFFGLDQYVDADEINRKEVLSILKKKYLAYEKRKRFSNSKILTKNIKKISKLMHLNVYEEQILEFTILINLYDILDDAANLLGDHLNSNQAKKFLSIILDIPYEEVENAFKSTSKLMKSSLVTLYKRNTNCLRAKLELISDEFADNMLTCDEKIEYMIKETVNKCELSELSLKDFNHLDKELSILLPYLKHSILNKNSGVNVLLYGVPGTGKTELTKTITQELNKDLFEISYSDEDDDPIEGKSRLKAYKSAQSLLSSQHSLIMFDEIEDVFNNDENPFSNRQKNKAWINRMLETNAIPTFWITNNINSIDRAVVRRFDMVIEVPIPKKVKRIEILQQTANNVINNDTVTKLAEVEDLAPALVSRAIKVVSSIDTKDNNKAFETLINNTLKAQGCNEIKNYNLESSLPSTYDPQLINSSIDLVNLSKGIQKTQNARICLYGPAGTGKSAYGKYIAKQLDKKILIKKGSDLISMWVGGTEKNIAKAFEEAKEEKAVLVFDEVDSFLADRSTAKNNWEITQVNEMLVQMENFDGIFIATTNLMNNLDQASLRRFDLKLEFSFLETEQAWKLFKSECKHIGIKRVPSSYKEQVRTLKYLTPGDYAAVTRQNRFNPIKNVQDFIERLQTEVFVKNFEDKKTVGFMS